MARNTNIFITLFPLAYYCFAQNSPCLTQFVEKYFGNNTPVCLIYKNPNILRHHETLFKLPCPKVLLDVNTKHVRPFTSIIESNINYIALPNVTEDLINILSNLLNYQRWNNEMKHLVIIDHDKRADIRKMLLLLWQYDVYNVVVVSPTTAYTWYPYNSNSKCGKHMKVRSSNICSLVFDPFENKVPNGKNCVLKVIWQDFVKIYLRT